MKQRFDAKTHQLTASISTKFIEKYKEKKQMLVQPLYDRIVVRRAPIQEKIGSILVPQTAAEKPQEFTVVAVGDGRLLESGIIPLIVKVGDRILLGKYSGVDVPEDVAGEKNLVIIREDDVLAILGKE